MADTSDFDFAASELAYNIDAYGKSVTITRRVSSGYNAATGTATVTSTDYTTKGFVLSYKDYQVDETLVLRGDRKLILSTTISWTPSAVLPVVGDIVTANGQKWNVVNVSEYELQGSKIGYVAQLRGSKSG